MSPTVTKFWEAARHMMENFVSRLPALFLGIAVFIVFYALSYLIGRAIPRAVSKRRQNLGLVFARLTGGATVLFGFLVAVSIVAPSFQASDLIKILGIGGVAIGFAFQNILQNFLAGLLLLWSEPFRVGDEIKLDAFEGKVEEIQTRATIIQTYDEMRVVIPNADLFTHSVIVNAALGSRRWQNDLIVRRTGGLERTKDLILNTIRKVPGVPSGPRPEALTIDILPDTVKMRVLWSTHDSRQQQMLASYDQVLTAIAGAIESAGNPPKPKAAA